MDARTRQAFEAYLDCLGPQVGIPTLEEVMPEVSRRELEHLLGRYRDDYRRKNPRLVGVLKWQRPGAVWAADFTTPVATLEPGYGRILMVRDLGARTILEALPVDGETKEAVVDALRALFVRHGAPLVLKTDNGAAFVAQETTLLLGASKVWHLRSPPRTPRYNGSCEAGIGALKVRAHEIAASHDRPGHWTCDDIEAARLRANEVSRPWGPFGPTPDEVWGNRVPIGQGERAAFAAKVRALEAEVRGELGYLPTIDMGPQKASAVERIAIAKALVRQGILTHKRRRIPLVLRGRIPAKIS